MVIDSSALIAILLREAEADEFVKSILASSTRLVGAPSQVETAMVMSVRLGAAARAAVDELLRDLAVEVVPFSASQAQKAIDAFLRFGKGRHPARLNFGDCCTYALAAELQSELLFKGGDFAKTDLRPAVPP